MNNESVTILTTWDDEKIEIPFDFETWLTTKIQAKNNGEDGIYLKSMSRYIKFSNIKDEKGKIKYISLPEPKKPKDLTPEARKNRDKMLKEIMDKTYDNRRKSFLERRKEILQRLSADESRFGFKTTLAKLQDLENYIKKYGTNI